MANLLKHMVLQTLLLTSALHRQGQVFFIVDQEPSAYGGWEIVVVGRYGTRYDASCCKTIKVMDLTQQRNLLRQSFYTPSCRFGCLDPCQRRGGGE